MRLSQDQLQEYEERGFLFFPSLLTGDEMEVLRKALEEVVAVPRREIVFEKDAKTLRSVFNMQTYNDAYARLVRHPKLLEPVSQILGGPAYVFQLILNFKAPFNG